MKTAIPLQQFKKCIVLFMVGTICSAIAYALYTINPVKLIFESKLQMAPDSLMFSLWRKPPIEIYVKVYVFNITNPTEFLKGDEKIKLQEVGPYVYQEFLENVNISWHDNGTITYTPKRSIYFVPEMSVGDPKEDLVSVPNIPMLGVSSALHDAGFFINYPFATLANMLNSPPILNISVYDYLWGYEDKLVELAGGIVPNFINFQKFGLLDRMYDEGENVINLNIRQNKNMTDENGRYLSIETYNGSPGLSHWGYEAETGNETNPKNTVCNRIQGATEGTVFPSHIDKHAVFRVFRKAFCRALPIEYKGEVWTDIGLPGYLYKLKEDFLDPPTENPENECYCRGQDTCMQKGLSDVTPCYYNIPAAISLPHFLGGDPSLLDYVEGLNPDVEKHGTTVILQPTIGVPIKVNSRFQTNLIMKHTRYNSRITAFNDMVLPLFWSDLEIPSLPQDLILLMKLALQVGPTAQTIFIFLLSIAGITMMILSMIGTVWVLNQQQQVEENKGGERRDSADLKIPLGYGQYTAIRILPAIKKITSKTDLFS